MKRSTWISGLMRPQFAALAAVLAEWRHQDARPVHLLTLMKSKKDWQAIVLPLLPSIDSLSCLHVDFDEVTAGLMAPSDALWAEICAALPPEHYPAIAAGSGGLTPQAAIMHVHQHLEARAPRAIPGQRIVIAGSLYLAGHILRDHS